MEVFEAIRGRRARAIIDYNSPKVGGSLRQHAESIDLCDFKDFLRETFPLDHDTMLQIKDEKKSAIKAINAVSDDLKSPIPDRETEMDSCKT